MAGLLTLGSSYYPRLPITNSGFKLNAGQWLVAGFVPKHSGGSVPDFHRFPY